MLVPVMAAALQAAQWHSAQRRKGTAGEPYVNHLLEVAALVAEATEGNDPNLVIAALLHDAIEDQPVSLEEIVDRYGEDAAALVMEVTDDKRLDKTERKHLQVEHGPHKSARAKMIKIADKTSNLRAIATSPPADWPHERKAEYLAWARRVVDGMRGTNVPLEALFDEAAVTLEVLLDRSDQIPVVPNDVPVAVKKVAHLPVTQSIELARQEGDDFRCVTLTADANGIRMHAQDMGPAVERVWGDDDYEFWVDVTGPAVIALLAALLKEKYAGQLCAVDQIRRLCDTHDIPHKWDSWT